MCDLVKDGILDLFVAKVRGEHVGDLDGEGYLVAESADADRVLAVVEPEVEFSNVVGVHEVSGQLGDLLVSHGSIVQYEIMRMVSFESKAGAVRWLLIRRSGVILVYWSKGYA